MEYFNKVGLTIGDAEVPLPNILFKDDQNPFFEPKLNDEGIVRYIVNELNTTTESMGVNIGDVFLGLNDKMFPEINQENANKINTILNTSFMWDDKSEFSITVQRNNDIITLKGIVGTPSSIRSGRVINDSFASESSKILRKAWLKN
jgi:hypothetical protein